LLESEERVRAGVTWTGVFVIFLGLVVVGFGTYYTNVTTEWAGGIVTMLGLFAGLVGAYMKRPIR
jgi:uncharacterized membrane protein